MIREGQSHLRYIDWNNLHYALEWIYEGAPTLKSQTVHHAFPGLAAWLIRDGNIQIKGDGKQIEAGPGDWVFPPFRSDTREFSDNLKLISLRFEATWGGANELYQETIPHSCRSSDFPKLEQTAKRLLNIAGPQMTATKNNMKFYPVDIHRHMRVQYAFLAWMQQYLLTMEKLGVKPHQVSITDERVRLARDYLDAYSFEMHFRDQDLAQRIGISIAQLNRIFVKDIGVTPTAYLNDRKVRVAKRALINTSAPIKQIAYELGFKDPANFTNWFQTRVHHSPREFRRLAMTSS